MTAIGRCITCNKAFCYSHMNPRFTNQCQAHPGPSAAFEAKAQARIAVLREKQEELDAAIDSMVTGAQLAQYITGLAPPAGYWPETRHFMKFTDRARLPRSFKGPHLYITTGYSTVGERQRELGRILIAKRGDVAVVLQTRWPKWDLDNLWAPNDEVPVHIRRKLLEEITKKLRK